MIIVKDSTVAKDEILCNRNDNTDNTINRKFILHEILHYLSGYGWTGCHIGDTLTGVLSYADNITLISPSLKRMNCMTQIC